MKKVVVKTEGAPLPIGPYSQAVVAGGFLFLSGQIAIDPSTGELVLTTIEAETRQVMNNLEAVLMAAGFDFSHVIKSTIFLSDMSLFSTVNEIYGNFFTNDYPARETVAVKTLPKSVNVEISMVAFK
jgi:2-iminobutanoate/2-iminopropanoate deaminase